MCKMKERVFEKKDIIYGMITGGATLLILSLIFLMQNRFPGQKFTLIFGDYYLQYYSVCRGFWDAVFHGRSLTFSFSWGMGLPTMTAYVGQVFSPFSILLYLIPNAEWAVFLTLAMKLVLAAMCFWYYLVRVHIVDQGWAVFFSLSYVFSSFVFLFYVNFHHMDALYILPLLICALKEYLEKGRSWRLTLLYAYSFINNFYNGYIMGIFTFLIFMTMLWSRKRKGKALLIDLLRFFGSVLQAVLVSMVVLLPTIAFFRQHMSGGSSFTTTAWNPFWFLPLSFLIGKTTDSIFNDLPAMYCGWGILLLAVSFFLNPEMDKKKKIQFGIPGIFLLICTVWKPAFLMMHAFNEPDSFAWRFSFMIIFLLVSAAAAEAKNRGYNGQKYHLVSVVILGTMEILSFLLYLFTSGKGFYISIPLFLLNLLLIFLWYNLYRKKSPFLRGLWIMEIFLAGCFFVVRMMDVTENLQDTNRRDWERLGKTVSQIEQLENTPFYRIAVLEPHITDAAIEYHYKGINTFSSMEHTALWQEMNSLGYSARPQQILDGYSTDFMNMIFSVAYVVDGYEEEGETGNVIMKKEHVLPPVFMASSRLKEFSALSDPLMNQSNLAAALTGTDHMLYLDAEPNRSIGGDIEESLQEDGSVCYTKTGRESIIMWTIPEIEGRKAYCYLKPDYLRSGLNETNYVMGGTPYTYLSRQAYPLCVPAVMEMLEYDGNSSVTLHMQGPVGTKAIVKEVDCVYQDNAIVEEVYQELLPGGMQITECGDDYLEGMIRVDEAHPVLFTSFPYDQGWHVVVDGEEMKTFPVLDGAFLSAELPAGTHEIKLFYRDDAFLMGAECALAGLALFLLTVYRERKNQGADDGDTDG